MPSPAAVGCDLELIEPRGAGFFDDYFTAEEQAMVSRMPEADRPWLLTLLWSAKESALKALRVGLRADTRSVVVSLVDPMRGPGDREEYDADPAAIHRSRWSPLRIAGENGRVFRGWWRRAGNFMYTVAPPYCRAREPKIQNSKFNMCGIIGYIGKKSASPILLEIRDDFRR